MGSTSVVTADVPRGASRQEEVLEGIDDALRLEAAPDLDGQALSGELVENRQDLQRPAVLGLVSR